MRTASCARTDRTLGPAPIAKALAACTKNMVATVLMAKKVVDLICPEEPDSRGGGQGQRPKMGDEGSSDDGSELELPMPQRRPQAAPPPPRAPLQLPHLKQQWEATEQPAEVFTVRFSADSTLVAAGLGNGNVHIYQGRTGRLSYQLATSTKGFPLTAMRFRPTSASAKTRNVLLTANADGSVQHWHVTSGKCLHTIVEPDNEVFAIDYTHDGSMFATAGKDFTVRIYDEATKTQAAALAAGAAGDLKKRSGEARARGARRLPSAILTRHAGHPADPALPAGHSNRVFSLRFHPLDEHVLLSAGWDKTIQMWDLRTGGSVRSIFGPHICGDSIDISGNDIVSGSWRATEQLQLFDYGSGELIANVPWQDSTEPCLLYAAQFSKSGQYIAAGGSGANEVRLFSRTSLEPVGVVNLGKGAFSVDFAQDSQSLAVAAGDLSVRAVAVPP